MRSAVGYCHECEILLCEVCGNECDRCHKTVCRSHIQRTSSGRNICVSCVVANYDKRAQQSKELRERRAERAELGRKTRKRRSGGEEQPRREERTPAGESLSFESLTRDLDETPYRASEGAPEPGPSRVLYEGAPLVDEEALNRRVLTGSASTRTPPWISGLCVSALAWVVLFSAWGASEIGGQRTILSLVALVLSLGTVIWTGPGAFSKAASPARRWIRVAFGLGLIALLLSGLGAWGAMS
ncbi:MAG: hypothetical protein KF886_25515 [Candidatus Hydrogenedentes bacterium]|nr:hypothetical protein [Candidatus Hydrogenedentota bacterium]